VVPTAAHDGGRDDDDDDLQANLDYDFARGAELENSLLRLRHQWELKDQKRREEVERQEEEEGRASVSASASASVGAKRKRSGADGVKKGQQKQGAHQIFSCAEATRMLCNKLFDLMKEEQEGFDGMSANCVEYNIHQWRVQVSDISPTSTLKADLDKIKARYGYSDLQLELSFIPDMHPFYPVFVKVLRPRFIGVTAEGSLFGILTPSMLRLSAHGALRGALLATWEGARNACASMRQGS